MLILIVILTIEKILRIKYSEMLFHCLGYYKNISNNELTIPERSGRPPARKKETIVQLPKPGDIIRCELNSDETEQTKRRILSKAGKATGKNRRQMNASYQGGEDSEQFINPMSQFTALSLARCVTNKNNR